MKQGDRSNLNWIILKMDRTGKLKHVELTLDQCYQITIAVFLWTGRGGLRGRGGFPGRGGRGRGRGRGVGRPAVTREQLDNQLDAYMSKTKGHLDAELDAYMAQADPDSMEWYWRT